MKCLSKTIVAYKRNQRDALLKQQEKERLATMTPEERERYLANRRKATASALQSMALINACLGDKHY